jgi:hypothetical protein
MRKFTDRKEITEYEEKKYKGILAFSQWLMGQLRCTLTSI